MDHKGTARPRADRAEYERPRLVEIGSVAGLTLAGSGSSGGGKNKPKPRPKAKARPMPKAKANARPAPKALQKKRTTTLRAFD